MPDLIAASQIDFSTGWLDTDVYSTAWVAMVPDADDITCPAWPRTLDYLRSAQLPDGGWGEPTMYYAHTRIISTMAALLALSQWKRPEDDRRIQCGLEALARYAQDITQEVTTRGQLRRCLEDWDKGDNGILDLSKAYRLKRGTGWLIPPGVLHAPGSLCTYEPQWGSDVFGMFQNIVEGRYVPWSLLVKDMPTDKHQDLDFIIDQLDWEKNVDPNFKDNNYLEPIVAAEGDGWVDRWIVYGTVDGKQLFSARELTVDPGASCVLNDAGASGWITVQGSGRIGKLNLQTPVIIRYGQTTEDEVFITHEAASAGVEVANTGVEPLVGLRYFGPDTWDQVPSVGDYRQTDN
jgi:hypothetical protein